MTNNNANSNYDSSLYSRQIYTIGKEAMTALSNSSVLIVGQNGLSLEVAKCVILSGVKSVTVNNNNVSKHDNLSTNYYANENLKDKLAELNPYVNVATVDGQISFEDSLKYNVVIVCDESIVPNYKKNIEYNNYLRTNGVKFITACTFGTIGEIFCDFGDKFTVTDTDGETPKSGHITQILNGNYMTHEPHGLYVDDYVTLVINGTSYVDQITCIKDLTTFCVKDLKFDDQPLSGAMFTQMKNETECTFKSLEESIKNPDFATIIQEDFERQSFLHNFMTNINETTNYDELIAKMNLTNDKYKEFVKKMYEFKTVKNGLCPMNSIVGSIASQEVIKALTHKYTPIKQWFYVDYESITNPTKTTTNDRYDAQRNVIGDEMQNLIGKSHVFIVGAGAIGCELLKNLAMLGVGKITVTDMDTIEKSNLSRQFLFRNSDIGKSKAECAKNAINKMNPDVQIVSQLNKVAPETLNIFNNKFFSEVTCVMTALDNIQARSFVDQLCVENGVPLIDSGTLGTKGNVQTIIPHLTESYRSSQDPPEKSIPVCTLKNFPYMIEHTIQSGRDLFEGLFVNAPKNYLRYKTKTDEVKNMNPSEFSEVYDDVKFVHENSVCHTKECIAFAYRLWHEKFRDQIYHLVSKFPEDSKTTEGAPFWSGTKKFPTVLKFSKNDINIEFLEATANLWADVFGLGHTNRTDIEKFLLKAKEPKIKGLVGDIVIDEKQLKEKTVDTTKTFNDLPDLSELVYDVKPLEFEKDDDTNFHIDFITSASNLRAINYGIQIVDKFKTKGIAGKIIPAVVTTTALVSGLATMEFLKVISGKNKLSDYTESFVNLALSFFSFSEPKQVKKGKLGNLEYSLWSIFKYDNITLTELIDDVKKKVNGDDLDNDVAMISSGKYLLYSTFSSKSMKDRLNSKVVDIYKTISKEETINELTVAVSFDDADSDEIVCKLFVDSSKV